MGGKFVLRNSGDQFFFNLKAANNEVILAGERYTTKASALTGIEATRTNAPIDERYQRKVSTSGQPYFVLRAANHEVLGTSETYTSAAARDRGITAVKAAAPLAMLEDETRASHRGAVIN